ncbi:response regulator [Paenibacillus sp. TRM 82003]|nr:response regulator [Paenibacillus sp. TRM 82003]
MHQLLIVDDQPDLVDDLAEMLPWDTVGIERVFKAYSAQEALEIVAENPIDVVITDIRMPGMSGLELIERIRKGWAKIRCILLSGYDDFEYAKQALQQRANDYLLKPAEDEELLQSVARAVKDIEEQWTEVTSFRNAMQSVKKNFPILRNHLLGDLLEGRPIAENDLGDQLDFLELPFVSGDPYCVLLLRLEDTFQSYSGRDISLMEYAVANMAEEIFSDAFRLWQTRDAHGYLVFLLQPSAGAVAAPKEEAERKASLLQHYIKLYLKGTASALLSHWGTFPEEIDRLYDGSLLNFRQRIGSEREFLLSMTEELGRQQPANSLSKLYDPPTLVHLLEAGQWDALQAKLDNVFDELEANWSHSHEHILETYFTIVSAFCYSVHKSKRWLEEIMGEDFQRMVAGPQFHTIQQLRDWVERILGKLKADMETETLDSRSNVVRQVQEYVHGHLGEASLQAIASHVHLNPSYLSKIYKMETGEGISDFLFRLKMEQAAHKLTATHEKIYEIAAGLGYVKTSYFIKVFKERYGMTPQEYRDKLT